MTTSRSTPHPNPAAAAAAEYAETEANDGDLSWILEMLTDPASRQFGLLIGLSDELDAPEVLASYADRHLLDDGCRALVLEAVRDIRARTPVQSESAVLVGVAREVFRLSYLSFNVAAGVSVLAVVGRPVDASSALQGFVGLGERPILERFLTLWWQHRSERRRTSALCDAMEFSGLAVALLDRSGNVRFASSAARTFLTAADGLRWADRKVGSTDALAARQLQAAIRYASLCNRKQIAAADARTTLVGLPRTVRRPLMAMALPLVRPSGNDEDLAVALLILDPESDLSDQLSPAFRAYRLSPAECRLVTHLVCGLNLAEAARLMRLEHSTTRSYLRQVFAKTGTKRQAELVRVMMASAVGRLASRTLEPPGHSHCLPAVQVF